jgi:Outer membrane protein beta-barrel domain
MKKNVSTRFLSTVAILMSVGLFNQVHAQTTITAYGAVGRSDIEVNGLGILDVVDPYIKPITQYTAGIQYEKYLSRQLAFVTGAQYSSRGFGAREEFNIGVFGLDLPVGAKIETRLNYLEVPVMLKYNFTDGGVTPYIKAGASTAYALNGKITPTVNAIITWQLPSININLENDMYNRFDISAVAGAGISIPTNEFGSIQLEANYRHSLNDMFLDNITDIRIKSHGLSFGIGYSVRF